MATYTELRQLYNLDALRNRIEVALAVKVNGVLAEAEPSSAKMEWARNMLTGSYHAAEGLLKLMLAANKQLTAEQILAASDEALQTAVDTAIDKLYA